jgi:hypothetical protein
VVSQNFSAKLNKFNNILYLKSYLAYTAFNFKMEIAVKTTILKIAMIATILSGTLAPVAAHAAPKKVHDAIPPQLQQHRDAIPPQLQQHLDAIPPQLQQHLDAIPSTIPVVKPVIDAVPPSLQ